MMYFFVCPEVNSTLEKGLQQPLLISSENKVDEDADQDCDDSEEAPEESRQPVSSIVAAYRLLTPSVKVCEKPPFTTILLDSY